MACVSSCPNNVIQQETILGNNPIKQFFLATTGLAVVKTALFLSFFLFFFIKIALLSLLSDRIRRDTRVWPTVNLGTEV